MLDLTDALYSTPDMSEAFSGRARVQRMLEFEAALARASARVGLIPGADAAAIDSACDVDRFDLQALFREAAASATPVIPLVRRLKELSGSDWVHFGATSQDAVDTGFVLQARAGLELLDGRLVQLARACSGHAEEHRATVMAGRTLMQQAVPITFGLKAARWLGLVSRQVRRLRELHAALPLQLGGAAGTLAAFGDNGPRIAALMAEELELVVPGLPWHAERDRIAELASALGVVAAAAGKIALDVVLLAQSEVAEVAEGSPGASSAMPHKRNPASAVLARAAARLAIGQVPIVLQATADPEHERAAGAWQAEWAAMPALFRYADAALEHTRAAVAGLHVDAERMRANLTVAEGGPGSAELFVNRALADFKALCEPRSG